MTVTVTELNNKSYTFTCDELRVVVNKDKNPRLIAIDYIKHESFFTEISFDNIDHFDIDKGE